MKGLKLRYSLLFFLTILLVSCGKYTSKTMFEAPEDGLIGSDGSAWMKDGKRVFLKNQVPSQIEVQKRGYKTQYGVWYRDKGNHWTFVELVAIPLTAGTISKFGADAPFVVGVGLTWPVILAGLIDAAHGPITSRNWENNLTKLPDYSFAESNVKVMDVEHCPAVEEYEDSTAKWMNSFCEEVGFEDDDDLDISGYTDYHIYSEVLSYNLKYTSMPRQNRSFKEMTLGVKYRIVDKFGTEIIDTTIIAHSGQFLDNFEEKYCYRDAIDYSMLYLLSNDSVKAIFKKKESKGLQSDYLQASEQNNELNYAYLSESIYKVHTEFGLAPLIPIAEKGLAVMSHHAYDLANEEGLIIISPKGDTIQEYKIVEESFTQDYVLVKLYVPFDRVFTINYAGKMNTDALARSNITSVGFNQYIDVLNAIDGKVNGERLEDNYAMYQLDLNVSDLLYPAIFSDQGQLLGFVSKTIDTRTVEGVSFFRPLIVGEN